jgi:Leucine-rich repeat (LRR) protein
MFFIDLSRNRFVEFPRVLCSFFSLERLNLYNNAIKSIPEQIVQIHMLKILDLRLNLKLKFNLIILDFFSSRNQLSYIPPALCKLPNLEVLIINNNKLISLPEEIGQLDRLIELVCL